MQGYSQTGDRFFDSDALMAKTYAMEAAPCKWVQAADVCKSIGVSMSRGAAIQIGNWATRHNVQRRKSNGVSMLLLPPLRATIQP